MKHKICIAIALVFFASCMKIKKKGDDEALTQTGTSPRVEAAEETSLESQRIQVVNSNKELSYKYIETEQTNLTQIQFAMPSQWPKEILVKRLDGVKVSDSVITPSEAGFWNDYLVSDNKVTYQFYSTQIKDLLLEEVEVLPVQNLELTEDLNLKEKFQLNSKTKIVFIRNLKINENIHLYFDNYSGRIIIQNLESNAGYLQSYSDISRAAEDQPGAAGGNLKIEILSGHGQVNVMLRGQNGGNGSAAQNPDLSKKGADGINARYGNSYLPGTCGEVIAAVPGEQGKRGYPGNNGRNGGYSGTAVVVNNSADLDVYLLAVAGKKGSKSLGGQGGIGGAPSLGLDGGVCDPAEPGKGGGEGPPGDDGIDGEDGQVQKSCLINPDQTKKCINE